jgi:uncharacterized protein YwgA
MRREDWLLLLLGFKGQDSSPSLDPVRIQKGMFLVAKESGLPETETYQFVAYNWGPYSRALRNDLGLLVNQGYAQARDVPGYSWKRYALTEAGIDRARELLNESPADAARAVAEIKRRVTGMSFTKLLDDVYAAYPDYAVNSLFKA